MKVWISLLAFALCFGFVSVTHAAKGDGKKLHGKVSSFSGDEKKGTLTITSGPKASAKEVTVETDDKTTVTLDGNPAKVTDLKAGLFVTVSPAEGTAATITATTTRPQHKKPADSSSSNSNKSGDSKSSSDTSKTGDSK